MKPQIILPPLSNIKIPVVKIPSNTNQHRITPIPLVTLKPNIEKLQKEHSVNEPLSQEPLSQEPLSQEHLSQDKACPRCKLIKPYSDFTSANIKGLHRHCYTCREESSNHTRETKKNYNKERRERLKNEPQVINGEIECPSCFKFKPISSYTNMKGKQLKNCFACREGRRINAMNKKYPIK